MTTWSRSTRTPFCSHHGCENKSSGRRRRRRRRRSRGCYGGGVRRALCAHHPPGQERISRFTQMSSSSPHFIHHEYVCERCSRSPLTNQSVMMKCREGLKKTRAKRRGGFQRSLLGCMYWAKTTPRKQTGRKTDPFGRFFRVLWRRVSRTSYRCQQYLNTSRRVILTSHAVYI